MPPNSKPPPTTPADNGVRDHTSGASPWDAVSRLEDVEHLNRMKVLLTGLNGSGKTSMAAKFERPLFLLMEHQGIPAIRRANPAAMVLVVNRVQDVKVFNDLTADPEFTKRVDAVVVDGLTDLQRIMRDFYTSRQDKQQSFTELDTWGLIEGAMIRFLRGVRDLPVHVVCTAIDEQSTIDGRIVHRPALQGAIRNKLGQFFNLCGYAYKRDYGGQIRHEVLFNGPESFVTKTMPELNDIEAPEPLLWAHKIFGGNLPPEVRARAEAWRALAGGEPQPSKADQAAAASVMAPPVAGNRAEEDPFTVSRQ